MESFSKLFGNLLTLVYHCFDRIVVQGYVPLLTRPEHIVHFFRDVHGIAPITKQVLAQRTTEYKEWVEAFARDHGVPIEWAESGVKKEDHVRPYFARFVRRRRVGVYFIFRSLEQGSTFRSLPPMAADPPIGSSNARGVASRTSASTSAMKSWDHSRCASAPSCRFRRPTILTGITSSPASWSGRALAFGGTTTPSCGPLIPRRCKRPRIA